MVGAGIGYMNAQFNGRSSDQLWGRVAIELMFGVRVADEASLGVRGGWDYLEWNDMNDYGHDLDMGGPYFAIELEGHG